MATKKAERLESRKKAPAKKQDQKQISQLSRAKQFGADVKTEFGKVAWPNKKHTVGSTVVVTILVMLISFYLGAVDLFLGKLVGYILQ